MTRVTGILAAAYQRGGMDRTDAEDAARKSVTLALRYGIDVPVDGFTPAAEASMGDTVAKAVDDHPGDTERLMRYWSHGEGAAKIGWGVPGDFDRCRAHLGKYVHDPHELAGLCANLHHRAIGVWPGEEDGGRGRHKSAGVDVPIDSVTVTKVGPHGYIHGSNESSVPDSGVEEPDDTLEKWDPLQPRDWHGRWSPASHEPHAGSHAARNLVDSLQEPDSGFSKHFDGTDAEHGSMVAVAGHTLQIDGHVPTIDELQAMDDDELESELTAWIGRNRQYFRDPSMYVGGWHDPATGKVFFDVAQNVTDREAAIRMGRSRGEISIYDIDAGRTFDTGGTGMRDEVPR